MATFQQVQTHSSSSYTDHHQPVTGGLKSKIKGKHISGT